MLSTSPFDAFARHEQSLGLPDGFIRSLNATNPHDNAWARLERNEVDFEHFCDEFEAEAVAAGGRVDARALFAAMAGRCGRPCWRPSGAATSISKRGS